MAKVGVMEQQLINAFMKFAAKAGAGDLVRELIWEVDQDGNPKNWTPSEMEKAIHHLNDLTDNFDKREALRVARTLVDKYHLNTDDLKEPDPVPNPAGVKGLQ